MSLETPENRNRLPISTCKVHTKIVKPLPDDAETALKFSPETFSCWPVGALHHGRLRRCYINFRSLKTPVVSAITCGC